MDGLQLKIFKQAQTLVYNTSSPL